jgi:hypothetical protein
MTFAMSPASSFCNWEEEADKIDCLQIVERRKLLGEITRERRGVQRLSGGF